MQRYNDFSTDREENSWRIIRRQIEQAVSLKIAQETGVPLLLEQTKRSLLIEMQFVRNQHFIS